MYAPFGLLDAGWDVEYEFNRFSTDSRRFMGRLAYCSTKSMVVLWHENNRETKERLTIGEMFSDLTVGGSDEEMII